MRSRNLIHDYVLKIHLLDQIRDGEKYQFSDFVPLFLRHWPYEVENWDSFPARIRLSLFEMEDKGWIEIESWSQVPIESLTFNGDFKFWMTSSGVEIITASEADTQLKYKRKQSQPASPSISVLVKQFTYPKPRTERTAKERIAEAIATQLGQQEFRQKLLNAYKKCLITGCDAQEVLEAAHIRPYSKGGTFELSNGLLLRADIHTLFDLGLIAVDSRQMRVIVAPVLINTAYGEFDGKSLIFPQRTKERPDEQALDEHRKEAGL